MSIANGEAILDELEGELEDFAPEETTDTYFVIIPLWILERASGEAIKLYGVLSTYLNPTSRIVWPSRQTLAERLGKSRPETIDRYLNELSDLGAIKIIPRYRADGGRTSSAYRIVRTPPPKTAEGWTPPPPKTEEAPPPKTADELRTIKNLEDRDSSLRSESRPTGPIEPVVHRKPTTVEIPEDSPATLWGAPGTELEHRARDYDAFDDFWAVYPRKDDKKKARAAYAKALREATPGMIEAGARAYAEDPNRDPAYTKLPTTWLNAGAWANGPLPPRKDSRNTQERMEDTARLTGNMIEGWRRTFGGGPRADTGQLAIDSTRAN